MMDHKVYILGSRRDTLTKTIKILDCTQVTTSYKDEFIIFNKEMERWQEEYNLWENLKKATVLNQIL